MPSVCSVEPRVWFSVVCALLMLLGRVSVIVSRDSDGLALDDQMKDWKCLKLKVIQNFKVLD